MDYRVDVPAELKMEGDEKSTIVGLASTFGNTDLTGDVIERGAFTKSLSAIQATGRKIPMLDSHDFKAPIGVWEKFEETEQGLIAEGKLTVSVQRAREVRDLIDDGAISALSIGFVTRRDEYDRERKVRIIKELDLKEVSPVVFPANPEARINALKMAPAISDRREFEAALVDHLGFSRNAAKSIAARGFMSDPRDEADDLDLSDLREVVDGLKSRWSA
jgi:HK97 family phage prohead protease